MCTSLNRSMVLMQNRYVENDSYEPSDLSKGS
jgi:hypothetical protein